MSEAIDSGRRDQRGGWQPPVPIQMPPTFVWPPRPLPFLKFLFGFPGYLWPWTTVYTVLGAFTWMFLTPDFAGMKSFGVGWIAFLFVRNLVMLTLIVSGWHYLFYVRRHQGTNFKYSSRWLAKGNPTFLFRDQVLDNVFWTLVSAVPVWTAYEVLTYWGQANGYLPTVTWRAHPIYCVILLLCIPAFREFHFYLIHRLIHWPPLYRTVHSLHHKNVNPGPWSGLAMHPVEHVLYFSGVLLHWIAPSSPVHVLFHLQHLAFVPSMGHSGFDRVDLGGGAAIDTRHFVHYLHHKYFEVNYGGDGVVPLDKWLGTLHDGSDAAHNAMNERIARRRG
jgi:sterol desaturase/sphingolipid hydroxylase (fatty acid hydroxylase superfamily)